MAAVQAARRINRRAGRGGVSIRISMRLVSIEIRPRQGMVRLKT
jgi:hypothetical protein